MKTTKGKRKRPPNTQREAEKAARIRAAAMEWVSLVRSTIDALTNSVEDTWRQTNSEPMLGEILNACELANIFRSLRDLECEASVLWIANPLNVKVPSVHDLVEGGAR